MNPQKRLIINADDLGLSEGVNRGIFECFKKGVLTSATLMVNTDGFAEAVRLLKNDPIPSGVHLNIVRGRPLTPPEKIPTLVDGQGRFHTLGKLFARIFLGRVSMDEIQAEFSAQARRALESGVKVTHFDSHRHVHNHPFVMEALKKVCVETGIKKVRLSCGAGEGFDIKHHLIDAFARRSRGKVLSDGRVLVNDAFANPFESMARQDYRAKMERFFSRLGEGVTEIGCHPGYRQGITLEGEASYDREKDLEFLLDPYLKELISRHKVKLLNYSHLKAV